MSDCPFARLGLTDTASADEVKAAWRTLARSLHPDLGGDPVSFDEGHQNYKAALQAVAARKCPNCHGTKRVTHTVGWTTVSTSCPTCG